ncbi:hypothetical protein HMPREF1990_01585 [Porphyromonas gingivalis W4087]|nr:hypothetical protein HMPREF1990_01585 [Porphyromonas gingivalis W4087]
MSHGRPFLTYKHAVFALLGASWLRKAWASEVFYAPLKIVVLQAQKGGA